MSEDVTESPSTAPLRSWSWNAAENDWTNPSPLPRRPHWEGRAGVEAPTGGRETWPPSLRLRATAEGELEISRKPNSARCVLAQEAHPDVGGCLPTPRRPAPVQQQERGRGSSGETGIYVSFNQQAAKGSSPGEGKMHKLSEQHLWAAGVSPVWPLTPSGSLDKCSSPWAGRGRGAPGTELFLNQKGKSDTTKLLPGLEARASQGETQGVGGWVSWAIFSTNRNKLCSDNVLNVPLKECLEQRSYHALWYWVTQPALRMCE